MEVFGKDGLISAMWLPSKLDLLMGWKVAESLTEWPSVSDAVSVLCRNLGFTLVLEAST